MNYLLIFILQIIVIILAARILGLLFRKLHQPQVIGEMVAGILLGPSLLGWLAPDVSAFIFPSGSLDYLNILSQLGLLLFMFVVGLEIDPNLLKGRGHAAVLISHVSIILPFMLGAILALALYPLLSNNTISFTAFALFLGASMSITAFPVLARILVERNLLKTRFGAITIACAAVDDVTAWSILAIVVTVVRSGSGEIPLWITIAGSAAFILIMLFVIRPLLTKIETMYKNKGNKLTHDILGIVIMLMLSSAWVTERLGIHALFGAFFMGAIIPRNKKLISDIFSKINDVTLILLLPVFFALTGLKTSIGLIQGTEMWFYFGLILLAAIGGKLGGSFIAARISGLKNREAFGVGILMNTRGLMELIILSIGLELGVISPALFAMMVMMALLTTFMATPILEWVYPKRIIRKELEEAEKEEHKYRILIPVSLPSSGKGLIKIASSIYKNPDLRIYALHLTRPTEDLFSDSEEDISLPDSTEALIPIIKYAEENSIYVRPLSYVTRNPAKDIISTAEIKGANLILLGWHKPVLSESILSGTVNDVLENAKADVCVYLERKFEQYQNILVPFKGGMHDIGALKLAHQIACNLQAQLTILHITKTGSSSNKNSNLPEEIFIKKTGIEDFKQENVKLMIVESDDPINTTLTVSKQNYDLIVLGLSETWGLEASLFSKRHEVLAHNCPASMLIVRKAQ